MALVYSFAYSFAAPMSLAVSTAVPRFHDRSRRFVYRTTERVRPNSGGGASATGKSAAAYVKRAVSGPGGTIIRPLSSQSSVLPPSTRGRVPEPRAVAVTSRHRANRT